MRTIILLSGGMDSTAALFWARETRRRVSAVSFDYGQRHRRELDHARNVAEASSTPHAVLPLSLPFGAQEGAVIPGRNLFLLNAAASHAGPGPIELVVGSCEDDQAGFLDCRPEFLSAAAKAISLWKGEEAIVVAPWIDRTKAQILAYAATSPMAWEWTIRSWSCYEGRDRACGACGACGFRAEGFRRFGAVDPMAP